MGYTINLLLLDASSYTFPLCLYKAYLKTAIMTHPRKIRIKTPLYVIFCTFLVKFLGKSFCRKT